MARADYIKSNAFTALLMALTPSNRLALLVSMETGLRIGDVLQIRTPQLQKERMTVVEQKTRKKRTVRITQDLRQAVLAQSSCVWAFPGRCDPCKHRTRQAVYKDLRRAAAMMRLPAEIHISPHTARKVYAVDKYHKSDLRGVQRLLQHTDEAVTVLYAMADALTVKHLSKSARDRAALQVVPLLDIPQRDPSRDKRKG